MEYDLTDLLELLREKSTERRALQLVPQLVHPESMRQRPVYKQGVLRKLLSPFHEYNKYINTRQWKHR